MLNLDKNTAMLVIDVQWGFDDAGHWGERNNSDAESNIARLLTAFRKAGRPVLHVKHDSIIASSPLHPGSPGNAIKPEAQPRAEEPIYCKSVNSAFIGTNLQRDLEIAGIRSLVVVGLTTNHCVSTTARMAGNFGFSTFVVSDATATFDRPTVDGHLRSAANVHAAALSDLHGEFATVVDTDTILNALARNTESATFTHVSSSENSLQETEHSRAARRDAA